MTQRRCPECLHYPHADPCIEKSDDEEEKPCACKYVEGKCPDCGDMMSLHITESSSYHAQHIKVSAFRGIIEVMGNGMFLGYDKAKWVCMGCMKHEQDCDLPIKYLLEGL